MTRMGRKEKLLRVRAQAKLVRQLGEKIRDMDETVHAVKLTGMPRGGGLPCGLDVGAAKKDAMERLLKEECARLRRYEREARKEMEGMSPELYAFSAMYYLCALTLEETMAVLERSMRQCLRYKQAVQDEVKEPPEAEDGEEESAPLKRRRKMSGKCQIDGMNDRMV